jgi:hypothetical protein
MSAKLTADQRFARIEKAFATLGREHLALEQKYLALVKLLFDIQPSPFVQYHREILARQLATREQQNEKR